MTDLIRRAREDERGATVVIVALSLIALFGMLVLVVDVGGLLVRRRALVNASDAGALAAAQQCATTGSTLTQAEGQADAQATANNGSLTTTAGTNITASSNCGTKNKGYVTVQYSSAQKLFFAPVLGAGANGNVTTAATAGWGPTGSANPVPIVLNIGTFLGACDLPLPDTAIGTKCYLWYDNDRFDGSSFGFLQLDQWNVPANASCNSSGGGNIIQDWINGLWNGGQLGLNFPQPTYVCVRGGNINVAWMDTLAARVGEILYFPINDWDGSITGFPQIMNNGGTQIDKFNVVGFAGLKLEGAYKANQTGPTQAPCPTTGSFGPFTIANGSTTDLLALANTSCAPYTRIVSVSATGTNGCCRSSGGNKDYDLVTDLSGNITGMHWLKAETNVAITMVVEKAGPCGPPPPNGSSHCIVVSWQGAQFGGETPNGGADFGLRAVTLCDRALVSCPDQK